MDSGRHDLQKDGGRTHVPPEGGSADFHALSASPMDGTDGAQSRRAPSLKLEASRDRLGSGNMPPDQDRAVQAEPDGEIAAYRARMLGKVGGDQNRAIAFTDAELTDFLRHAKGLGFGQEDIEAILAVKVRKPGVEYETLIDVANYVAKKREAKCIGFKEGWDFMKAYRAAQDAMLAGSELLPNAYLDESYISGQFEEFSGKASYLLPGEFFDLYVNPDITDKENLGYSGALYVSSPAEIDRILQEANGDISKVEIALGIQPGKWQGLDGIWRVDIIKPESKGMRFSVGNEKSANPYWTPGGVTSGGTKEMVLDEVPRIPENHQYTKVIF